jgi:hypothetical protein
MTDQSNVFNNTEGTQPPTQPTSKDYGDLLSLIKNEDGSQKYQSIEKALEALAHSQLYIPQLKNQLQEREAKLQEYTKNMASQEELLKAVERLTANQGNGNGQPPAPVELDEQTVSKTLESLLTKREAESRAKQNGDLVSQELVKRFGDKAKDAVSTRAAELGMTPDELGQWAKRSPQAVLALFSQASGNKSTVTTGGLNIPPINKEQEEPIKYEGSLKYASDAVRGDVMRQIRERLEAKYGIQK